LEKEVSPEAVVAALKALLRALSKVWGQLPEPVKAAAGKAATALGYPKYPKPVRKEDFTVDELWERVQELEEALREKTLEDMKPLAKSIGVEADSLLRLKDFDEALFTVFTGTFEKLKKFEEVAKEVGSEAPPDERSITEKIMEKVAELEAKGVPFSEALTRVSAELSEQELQELRRRRNV